jgi:hypothetical protein
MRRKVDDGNYLGGDGEDAPHTTAENLVFPVKKMTHKKVTAKNDPPESTRTGLYRRPNVLRTAAFHQGYPRRNQHHVNR